MREETVENNSTEWQKMFSTSKNTKRQNTGVMKTETRRPI